MIWGVTWKTRVLLCHGLGNGSYGHKPNILLTTVVQGQLQHMFVKELITSDSTSQRALFVGEGLNKALQRGASWIKGLVEGSIGDECGPQSSLIKLPSAGLTWHRKPNQTNAQVPYV
jgi:hypothetical protein